MHSNTMETSQYTLATAQQHYGKHNILATARQHSILATA